LELALYMLMWVKAPNAKSNRNTMETGTSGSGDGKPPGNPPSAGSRAMSISVELIAFVAVPDKSPTAVLEPATTVAAALMMVVVGVGMNVVVGATSNIDTVASDAASDTATDAAVAASDAAAIPLLPKAVAAT
jgi:hypothetical protein